MEKVYKYRLYLIFFMAVGPFWFLENSIHNLQ